MHVSPGATALFAVPAHRRHRPNGWPVCTASLPVEPNKSFIYNIIHPFREPNEPNEPNEPKPATTPKCFAGWAGTKSPNEAIFSANKNKRKPLISLDTNPFPAPNLSAAVLPASVSARWLPKCGTD